MVVPATRYGPSSELSLPDLKGTVVEAFGRPPFHIWGKSEFKSQAEGSNVASRMLKARRGTLQYGTVNLHETQTNLVVQVET